MKNQAKTVYTETQSLNIPAVRIILGAATAFVLGSFAWKLYGGWSEDKLLEGLPPLLILAFVWWIALGSRIYTRITAQGIAYRFYPFQLKDRFARWGELKEVYLREYNALADYGGWGLRWGFSRGWGYVAQGDMGVQLVYKNGKKRFISTQHPETLRAKLEQWAPEGLIGPESR